jgi:hypothetical protein
MEEEKIYTGLWWESAKERGHSKDRRVDGRMGSKWILRGLAGRMWNGLIWLRIRTGGGLL